MRHRPAEGSPDAPLEARQEPGSAPASFSLEPHDIERVLRLFERSNDGIFVLSREGRLIGANRRFCELVGLPYDELMGREIDGVLPGRFLEAAAPPERVLRDGAGGPFEVEVSRPDGVAFISLDGFPLVENGRSAGSVYVARDVTKQHRGAEGLRAAREEALESSRLKSSFLANVSHEIRTPLNVMLGYASLLAELAEGSGDTEQVDMVGAMRRAGERLERTIDSILDISKIESGTLEVRPERIELAPLVERQVEDFKPLASAKGLALRSEIEEREAAVSFDAYCLGSALMNLVANAIKFTARGEVCLELSRAADGGLRLRVRDTGMGMDPAFLPRVGEPFAQEKNGFARRLEGTGLGLALTKRYLELNGASLSVESEKGKGSVFTIHFTTEPSRPRAPASPGRSGPGEAAAASPPRPRVLVVDDDEETQHYMAILLGRSYDASTAATAKEAVEVLAEREVDVVLMDVSLRGSEDGLALTRRLRADPRWRDLPIIALTAHALPGDRARVHEAGCDEYVAKPFDPRELERKIAASISRRPSAQAR